MAGHTQNLELLIRAKNAGLMSQAGDKHEVIRSELLLAQIDLAAYDYSNAMINLISAASLAAELAGKPIKIEKA